MLDHIGIYVTDPAKGKVFYEAALKPLNYRVHKEFPEWGVVGFGDQNADFWISKRDTSQNAHVAFKASSKDMVAAFHAACLSAGGTDNGAPGYRKDYGPGYYGAFITDPFGNNIEAVFQDPDPSE